jgi:hypothetical protein
MIELNYNTHMYSFFLDGAQIGSTGFVDHNPGNQLDEFTDANLVALAAAGDLDSQALTGTSCFDNFLVTSSNMPCIPEPSTSLLALLGLVGLAAQRRAKVAR